jgi:hypothetical protein
MSVIVAREQLEQYLRTPMAPQLVYVAAKLGIADLLQDGPKYSAELAHQVGAHAAVLHRILRAMVSIGLLTEQEDGRFHLTPMGEFLQGTHSGSLRDDAIVYGEEFRAWGGLLHTVETGETAFDHVFGIGMFTHFAQNPALELHFNRYMAKMTAEIATAVVAAYDFSLIHTLVDIGGGYGTLLTAILTAHPSMQGILFDLPQVLERARRHLAEIECAARCTLVPGSFLESVPAGGDAYILQVVIHDWDDEHALQILEHCRAVIKAHGTLLLVERLMPKRVVQAPEVIQGDINMLVLTGGRERTESEYYRLLATAGFQVTGIIPTHLQWSVIEGRPI